MSATKGFASSQNEQMTENDLIIHYVLSFSWKVINMMRGKAKEERDSEGLGDR